MQKKFLDDFACHHRFGAKHKDLKNTKNLRARYSRRQRRTKWWSVDCCGWQTLGATFGCCLRSIRKPPFRSVLQPSWKSYNIEFKIRKQINNRQIELHWYKNKS